jgi:hypothetical protein
MIESVDFLIVFFSSLLSVSILCLFIYSLTIPTPEKAINI